MPKRELTPQQLDQLRHNIKVGKEVKVVLNMREWRETMASEAVRLKDHIQRQSYAGIDPVSRQFVPTADPQIAVKGTYMIAGIDALLLYFNTLVTEGESAKNYFKEPDNATQ